MSDIIFIIPHEHLSGTNTATISPSLGIAYLASTLKANGFSCTVIDMTVFKVTGDDVIKIIKKEKPAVVGISANLFTGNAAINLCRQITNKYGDDLMIIFGGAFPTSRPEKFLLETSADCVVLGEGEYTLLEIMSRLRENSLN